MSSIEEELENWKEASNSRERTPVRAKIQCDLFAQLARKTNEESSQKCRLEQSVGTQRSEKLDLEDRFRVMQNENQRLLRELEGMRKLEFSLNARINGLEVECALLKNVVELQQRTQVLSANLSSCNDEKCRLEQSVEVLRNEKLDLENRLQVMQNENERLLRELDDVRELVPATSSTSDSLISDFRSAPCFTEHNWLHAHVAYKIPKIERSVEEIDCEESESVRVEQVEQNLVDQVSDKDTTLFNNVNDDVKKKETVCSEIIWKVSRRTQHMTWMMHQISRSYQKGAVSFNIENYDVKEVEGESLFGDDIESEPEDSDYDMDDDSDLEALLEGARQAVDRGIAQRDEEENGKQKRCYNCGVTRNTGIGWKRVDGKTSCSACKQYRNNHHGQDRPKHLWRRSARSGETCYNCPYVIPKGRSNRVQGKLACGTCKRYYDRNGHHRPEHLWRKPPRKRLIRSVSRCYNCPSTIHEGASRRRVEGNLACGTCGKYYQMTGRHRPEYLWRIAQIRARMARRSEQREYALANVDDVDSSGSSTSDPRRSTTPPRIDDDVDLNAMANLTTPPVADDDIKVNLGVHYNAVVGGETFIPHRHQHEAAEWCSPTGPD
ncbi:hypothetical protein KIN20_031217 [Parelaphostrongylus tenuis]|uniref:GATA-type domain-containing protein n=1 Tax=Parelaphostrongylus tenuis TaxID=148309 RepID=A0AAD5R6H1_PARTN|nr:hypothetical protein KIN20_031217 [Parelaphostrongylus tenuis]